MKNLALNIGLNNYVIADKIISITGFGTAPAKRLVKNCKDKGMVIDGTEGRKTRSVIVLEGGFVALSSTYKTTLAKRYNDCVTKGIFISIENEKEEEGINE